MSEQTASGVPDHGPGGNRKGLGGLLHPRPQEPPTAQRGAELTASEWTEQFDVRYYDEGSIVACLRKLADDLAEHEDEYLVLIGCWNVESMSGAADGMLQVALSRQVEVPRAE